MDYFQEPIILRSIERIIIAIGGVAFAFLGYKLYLNGASKGQTTIQSKSKIIDLVVSGQGPGLVFMAVGGLVLLFSLFNKSSLNFSEKATLTPSYQTTVEKKQTYPAECSSASLECKEAISRQESNFIELVKELNAGYYESRVHPD